jgi:hypothetical protein
VQVATIKIRVQVATIKIRIMKALMASVFEATI